MDKKKKFYLNLETFLDIFQICPGIHGQDFNELPTVEVIVYFFKELGHTGEIKSLSRKSFGLEKLCLSRAQIFWGMYYKKNMDYFNYFGKISLIRLTTKVTKSKTRCTTFDSPKLSFTTSLPKSRQARLPEAMTSPEMRETKAYNTYLSYVARVTPPKKARKFKKHASPKLTTIPASPKEPTKKSKRVKRPAKKSTNAPTIGVVIRDTHSVSVSKKKAPAKADRGKAIELLLDAALLEDAQLKKALMKNRQETHKFQESGSSEETDFKSEVPDEFPKSDDESWGDSDDDNENDDNDDKGSENDDDSGNDAQDSERTDSDEEENPNLNLAVNEEEETQKEEYVHTTDYSVPTDEESDDENKEFDDEEYDDLYKDANVRSKIVVNEELRKGDVEMPDVTRESGF
nr:hypothetical protein [Tanacetum cinerariifolium]